MADEDNFDEIEKKATAELRSNTNMRKWIDEGIKEGNRKNAVKALNRKNSTITQSSSVVEDRKKSKKKSKNKNNNDVESITSSMGSSTISDETKSDTSKMKSIQEKSTDTDFQKDPRSINHHCNYLDFLLGPEVGVDSAALAKTDEQTIATQRSQEDIDEALARRLHEKYRKENPSGGKGREPVGDAALAATLAETDELTMAGRQSQIIADEALALALEEEDRNESRARRGRSLPSSGSEKKPGGVSRERRARARSVPSGRGSQGRSLSSGSGSTAGTKVGSGASLKVPPAGVIESDDDDYDSEDSDFVLNDEEEEAYDPILEEEIDNTKQYFFPPNNYVRVRERQGINTDSTCAEYIRHYIERTDPKNRKLLKEMRWNPKVFTMDQDYIINVLAGVQTRYLNRKNHQNRVFPPDILEDICLLASLLGDENWLPDYVKKIDKALRKTEEHKPQNAVEPSPTILLGFKLMCPKPNRHLNEGNDGDENGPTEKACKAISIALKGSLMDCGSPFLNPLLSFGSFLGHERMICPCTSPSFRHQGCGWETNREGMINAFIRNLLVQLCLQYNCTMIWLNFNGANGEFAFDLQDHKIVSYKKLFHPSLATYVNCKVYGHPNNQKRIVSRRVRHLADYLGTQLGDRFDKSKFLQLVFGSTQLKMIDSRYTTHIVTEANLSSSFVTKVREQKREKKFAKYKESQENIQVIGIKSHIEFVAWSRNNRPTMIKLGIPSDPHQKYANHGWTTWYDFFGTQPCISVASGSILSYTDCAIVVQGLGISSEPKFRIWKSANSDQRQRLGIPSNPHQVYKDRGWSTWKHFLGKLPDCIQCRNEQKECVYSIAESQCQRCTVLEQVCTIPDIWDVHYSACWKYKEENGGTLKRLPTNNKSLNRWLERQLENKHSLSAVQKKNCIDYIREMSLLKCRETLFIGMKCRDRGKTSIPNICITVKRSFSMTTPFTNIVSCNFSRIS